MQEELSFNPTVILDYISLREARPTLDDDILELLGDNVSCLAFNFDLTN
jgi:hypothetical protein